MTALLSLKRLHRVLAGTFNYEFVCDLGKRIPRNYYLNGQYIGSHDYFHENWKLITD